MTGAAFGGGASYDVSGSTVGKSDNKIVPMSETQLYIDLNSQYTLADNGTPLAGMNGDCMGYMEVMVGIGAKGSGVCVWADADGDTWFGPWTVSGMGADGTSAGTWYVSGGTGKFENANGGGTFGSRTNPETGETALDVSGSVTLN